MKKLIIAAAAVALMSGAAFAQSTMAPKSGQMNAAANSAFCLDMNGTQSCKFASMADCQKQVKGSGKCIANPKATTTGTGAASPSSTNAKPNKSQ